MNKVPLLLVLLLCLGGSAFAAEPQLRLFELKHRAAEQLLPHLPTPDEHLWIGGFGDALFARAPADQLDVLAAMVERLDVAPRTLSVQLLRTDHRVAEQLLFAEPAENVGRAESFSTRRIEPGFRARVSEGEWTRIREGGDYPQVEGPIAVESDRVLAAMQQVEAYSGFEAQARIFGETAEIRIRPFSAEPSRSGGGVIDRAEFLTTLRAPVGRWFLVGGSGPIRTDEDGRRLSTERNGEYILMKVELVEP